MTHRFDPAIEAVLHDAFAAKGYGARLRNILHAEQVRTLGDLLALSEVSLMRTPNMGQRTLDKLIAALATHDLALNGDSYDSAADRLSQIEQRIAVLEGKILK
jgi:DNA-directed RNA polymerase alpha subunit